MTLSKEEKEKIERYANDLSNEAERSDVENMFIDGEENNELRSYLEKDWDNIDSRDTQPVIKLNNILDRIHHVLRKSEYQKDRSALRRLVAGYMKVAAIVLLPLLLGGAFYYVISSGNLKEQGMQTSILAPLGARVEFVLPDGTKGMLNSGSNLEYSLPFGKNRNVTLKGEAWFEVTHDAKHPFEINAGNSTLTVLGTTFNISAYPEENFIEIVLEEGSVELGFKDQNEKVIILPSERLVYQNGKICRSEADPSKYNAWTEGKLVFRGDSMTEVARRLERWYNIEVELADSELENYSFRATFEDDSIEEVLKFLSMTSPILYKVVPRQVSDDGTLEKQKVIFYLKNNQH